MAGELRFSSHQESDASEHRVLREMYRKEIAHHNIYSSWHAFLDSLDVRAFENWSFFCGPVLTIPLLLLPASVSGPAHSSAGGDSGADAGAESFPDGFVSLSPWADCSGSFCDHRARFAAHLRSFVPSQARPRDGFCSAASAMCRRRKHIEAGGRRFRNHLCRIGSTERRRIATRARTSRNGYRAVPGSNW